METAKVDIRKLQVLNDRISQTIEALNQVRLSVHGLASNGAFGPPQPWMHPFVAAQLAHLQQLQAMQRWTPQGWGIGHVPLAWGRPPYVWA
jgi:hypothetical protein